MRSNFSTALLGSEKLQRNGFKILLNDIPARFLYLVKILKLESRIKMFSKTNYTPCLPFWETMCGL